MTKQTIESYHSEIIKRKKKNEENLSLFCFSKSFEEFHVYIYSVEQNTKNDRFFFSEEEEQEKKKEREENRFVLSSIVVPFSS